MKTIPLALLILVFTVLSVDVRGQEAPKDQKPKDAKDIAVEYMLGEPDRLLKEFATAKDELAKTKAKPVRTHFNGNLPNGTPPFFPTEEMKASFVTGCERTVLLVEKKLEEAKAGDISIPRLLNPDDEGSLEDCRVGKVGLIVLRAPRTTIVWRRRYIRLSTRTECWSAWNRGFKVFVTAKITRIARLSLPRCRPKATPIIKNCPLTVQSW